MQVICHMTGVKHMQTINGDPLTIITISNTSILVEAKSIHEIFV